jgi:hypothetical protein
MIRGAIKPITDVKIGDLLLQGGYPAEVTRAFPCTKGCHFFVIVDGDTMLVAPPEATIFVCEPVEAAAWSPSSPT